MDWFQHEASLRDPGANWFVIAPFIRRTLLEYHKRTVGTKESKDWEWRGQAASAEAHCGAFVFKVGPVSKRPEGWGESR